MIHKKNFSCSSHPGYIILAACAISYSCTVPSHSFGMVIFFEHLIHDLSISRVLLSSLWAIAIILTSFLVPVCGYVIDKFGARPAAFVFTFTSIFAFVFMGTVSGPISLCIGFFLLRLGNADSVVLMAQTTTNRWFVKKRGFANALLNVCDAAMLAFPTISEYMVAQVGWRHTFFILAAVLGSFLFISSYFIYDSPESIGYLPDCSEQKGHMESVPVIIERSKSFREALCSSIFWTLLISFFSSSMYVTGMNFHMVGIGGVKGFSEREVAHIFPWISFGTITGSAGIGLTGFADRFPKLFILIGGFAVTSISMLILVFANDIRIFSLYAFVFGFGSGIQTVVNMTIWSELFGRKDLGKIQGFTNGFQLMACGVGPIIFGISERLTGDFRIVIESLFAFLLFCQIYLFCFIMFFYQEDLETVTHSELVASDSEIELQPFAEDLNAANLEIKSKEDGSDLSTPQEQ